MHRRACSAAFALAAAAAAALPGGAGAFDPADQDDSAALARHFAPREAPLGPPLEPGAYAPLPGETATLMGGTVAWELWEDGRFESLLQAAFPEARLRFRCAAWPADTVERQQRPMFFYTETGDTREGSLPDLRERIPAGTFVLLFGRMESLGGIEALPAFEAAYERLLEALAPFTSRLVLAGPVPFGEAGPAGHLAAERNAVLAGYAGAVEGLARRRGAVFAPVGPMPPEAFASNGMHLSPEGRERLARSLAGALGVPVPEGDGGAARAELRERILERNRLWYQYYRPTNWAFLFGDRQHVPSSRDHVDSDRRWFVEELEALPSLIAAADGSVWEAAAAAAP